MNGSQAPKPKLTIDGRVIEFEAGDTIMRVAEKAAIDHGIPRFCYHPGLPVAGTCRMCAVEVEKAPKLMTACSTPAADGMVVHTQSERVKKSHAGVMEFLLVNHPLDCPVCDQAGECSLQDYNFEYGPHTSEFKEEKRVFEEATTKKLSDRLTLNMNRCIHCERCVRFTESVTKTNELLMTGRGWRKELTTGLEDGMFNEYQGNIADICPVGAITFNDFRFKKRVWFLKEKKTLCDGCSRGCSVFADIENNVVYRYRARENAEVNDHWICDSGRVSFHHLQDKSRIVEPMLRSQEALVATNWQTLLPWLTDKVKKVSSLLFVIGTDATNEEAKLVSEQFSSLVKVGAKLDFCYFNGVENVATSQDDEGLDQLLRRKDRTPNTKGLEALGLKPLKIEKAYDLMICFRSGRSALPPANLAKESIGWGYFLQAEIGPFAAVLPGLTTLEKRGTFTNCDGIVQAFEPILSPPGSAAALDKILRAFGAKSEHVAQHSSREVSVGSR